MRQVEQKQGTEFRRRAEAVVKRLAASFPCVGITGPRQSGKTTLAKQAFPDYSYVNFEDLDMQMMARNDIRYFLTQYPDGAIFDEVQHIPELVSYLQGVVDADDRPGRFVLTSSQNLVLSQSISQSLAGCIGMVTLLPFSYPERGAKLSLDEAILSGGYPRMITRNIRRNDFFLSYFATYVQRDVLLLKAIEKIPQFQKFIRMCAARVGQIVNYNSLALDCDVSVGLGPCMKILRFLSS